MMEFFVGLGYFLVKMIVGIGAGAILLRGLDVANGADFKREIYPILKKDPVALASYHRGRLIYVGLVVLGACIGALT